LKQDHKKGTEGGTGDGDGSCSASGGEKAGASKKEQKQRIVEQNLGGTGLGLSFTNCQGGEGKREALGELPRVRDA